MDDDLAVIHALLAHHGIAPAEDELEMLAATYPVLRANAARLHDARSDDDG